jgi:hypothetical protein
MDQSKAKESCSGTTIPAFKFDIICAMPFQASCAINHSSTAASTDKFKRIILISALMMSQPVSFVSVRTSEDNSYINPANYGLPCICSAFTIPTIVRYLTFTA